MRRARTGGDQNVCADPKRKRTTNAAQNRSTCRAKTYPTPRSVWMICGALGSCANLRRRRRICASMLRSKTSSCTRVACRRCSRLSGRCGTSRKATSSAYSPLVNAASAPFGSVSLRVRQIELPAGKPIAAAFWLACRRGAGPVEPPNDRAHPRQKLTQVKGLRHIVVGAQLKTDHPVDLIPAMTGDDGLCGKTRFFASITI
jgi:hypothetical protein